MIADQPDKSVRNRVESYAATYGLTVTFLLCRVQMDPRAAGMATAFRHIRTRFGGGAVAHNTAFGADARIWTSGTATSRWWSATA